MDTKTAVLDTALDLFNRHGTAAVSTNHIAQARGISPGNLYYHYRNKREIIRALFERLFDVWDRVFTMPEDRRPVPEDIRLLVRANFEVLWAYRFAYRELVVLLRQDDELRQRFMEARRRGFAGFQELFNRFVEAGVIPAPGDLQAIADIAELCWLVSEFWLPYLEVSGQEVNSNQLERGVQLMLRVIQST